MTIKPKHIYITLTAIILTLSLTLYFIHDSNKVGENELKKQIEESYRKIGVLDRVIHDAKVERGMYLDTVTIIKRTIINNKNTYVQEILGISNLDANSTDSLYRLNSHSFDRQFADGLFLPK